MTSERTPVESWTHGFAEVEPDVRLHYVSQGPEDGPLMVLLHGFPEFWFSWRHQIPVMAEAGYRVIAPDMRGYNESDKPKGVKRYAIDRLSADVMELIRHFGRESAVIVAHDWGGGVAWQFALQYPDATDRLIVMNAPHPAAFARELGKGKRPNLRQLRRSWYMFFFQIPWLPEFVLLRNPGRFIESAFRGRSIRKDAFSDDDIAAYTEAVSKPGALSAGINYYRAALRGPLLNPFNKPPPMEELIIRVPTLLIWGEQDHALGIELTHDLEAYFEAPFEIHYVPDTSHWVQQEQPEDCSEATLDFLARHASA
jgi:pimeloyl-ACP methyl ester carboxylesterase